MSKQVLKDIDIFDNSKPKKFSPHPLYDHYGALTSREEARRKLNLEGGYNYLLFFGIIRDYKGLDLALLAMADERLLDYKVKLIVAGEFYSSPDPYLELIEKHGLSDRVILKSAFIPDEEVADYFNAADLVVQPYKSATQSGITQISFHFNKPVLVTNVGGLDEIVPHGKAGYVVEKEPVAITDAILDFYKHNRYSSFREEVKEIKKKYSWNYMISEINTLFHEIKTNNNE